MKISSRGIALIKEFEGLRLFVYLCPAGHPTVGWGHRLKKGELEGVLNITMGEAEAYFAGDVAIAAAGVLRLTAGIRLTQGQFDALCSFVFNLGEVRFEQSTLRRKLLEGDLDAAAEEFPRWIYSKGKVEPGLVRRRAAEAELFMTPDRTLGGLAS